MIGVMKGDTGSLDYGSDACMEIFIYGSYGSIYPQNPLKGLKGTPSSCLDSPLLTKKRGLSFRV